VDPAQEGVAIHELDRMLGEIATDPDLVSARVFESDGRRSIAAVLEMRSVDDGRRLEQLPEVGQALDHLHGTIKILVRLYRQIEARPA
jgi:hypothetical protein